MADDVSQIRNVGIVGQGGGGKTSLADAILFAAGAATRLGQRRRRLVGVRLRARGDAPQAEPRPPPSITRRGRSTRSPSSTRRATSTSSPTASTACAPARRRCSCSSRAPAAVEGRGRARVERAPSSWRCRASASSPRWTARTPTSRRRSSDLQRHPAARKPVPVQLPIGSAESFRGVVDLISMQALIAQPDGSMKEEAIPADLADAAKAAREQLIEAAAETDDALIEQYLESGELTDEQLDAGAARRRCASAASCRCCAAPAPRSIGIAPLLDFVVDYLAVAGRAGRRRRRGSEDQRADRARAPSPSAPFSAIVFKTIVDPFSGKLSVFQVRERRAARRLDACSTSTRTARSASAICCASRARSRRQVEQARPPARSAPSPS